MKKADDVMADEETGCFDLSCLFFSQMKQRGPVHSFCGHSQDPQLGCHAGGAGLALVEFCPI